jgi:alkylation response protein AidB-like acyl-CoA dehydrogenase
MFPLSAEQAELRKAAAIFGRTLARDLASREASGEFSRADWNLLAARGFTGILAEPPLAIAARLEGLGSGCPDNGLLMSLHAHLWGCALPIREFRAKSLSESFVSELSSGKRIGAIGATEALSGSDFLGMETRAEPRGDRFSLSGRKSYVTNAPVADVFVVYAKTSPADERSPRSVSAFVIDRNDPGVSIGKTYAKAALRTSPMAELELEGCVIGRDRLLGELGDGILVFNRSMQWERALILSTVVGAMERLLEACLAYARSRKTGGNAISNLGGVKRRLVAIKTRHEASRLLVYRAAQALEGDPDSMLLSSLAKRSVSDAYVETCQDAMAIFGAQGLMTELGIERELRDAMASVIYSGTSDIQDEIIARLL